VANRIVEVDDGDRTTFRRSNYTASDTGAGITSVAVYNGDIYAAGTYRNGPFVVSSATLAAHPTANIDTGVVYKIAIDTFVAGTATKIMANKDGAEVNSIAVGYDSGGANDGVVVAVTIRGSNMTVAKGPDDPDAYSAVLKPSSAVDSNGAVSRAGSFVRFCSGTRLTRLKNSFTGRPTAALPVFARVEHDRIVCTLSTGTSVLKSNETERALTNFLPHQKNGEQVTVDLDDEMKDLVSVPTSGQVIAVGRTERSFNCSNVYDWITPTDESSIFIFRAARNLTSPR
jgi:hypothetical protein